MNLVSTPSSVSQLVTVSATNSGPLSERIRVGMLEPEQLGQVVHDRRCGDRAGDQRRQGEPRVLVEDRQHP